MRRLALALTLAVAACAAPSAGQGETGLQPGAATVAIPDGTLTLQARFAQPVGTPKSPAVVALHGCGRPWPGRDRQWERLLTDAGHQALFPDSFGSRG